MSYFAPLRQPLLPAPEIARPDPRLPAYVAKLLDRRLAPWHGAANEPAKGFRLGSSPVPYSGRRDSGTKAVERSSFFSDVDIEYGLTPLRLQNWSDDGTTEHEIGFSKTVYSSGPDDAPRFEITPNVGFSGGAGHVGVAGGVTGSFIVPFNQRGSFLTELDLSAQNTWSIAETGAKPVSTGSFEINLASGLEVTPPFGNRFAPLNGMKISIMPNIGLELGDKPMQLNYGGKIGVSVPLQNFFRRKRP